MSMYSGIIYYVGCYSSEILEFEPETNTTFTCVGTVSDRETGATFKIKGSVHGIHPLPQGVVFVRLDRYGDNGAIINNITVTLSSDFNGTSIYCCFINETHTTCRESFILVCCAKEGT